MSKYIVEHVFSTPNLKGVWWSKMMFYFNVREETDLKMIYISISSINVPLLLSVPRINYMYKLLISSKL